MITILSCTKPVRQEPNIGEKADVKDWKSEVKSFLQLFGHRNWIVIADAAYPKQSNKAIKTLAIDADQLEAVEFVNQLIEKATHVKANIFIDKKMEFVPEKEAKGIENYRAKLDNVLEGKPVKTMLHDDIIQKIDASAKLFNVLIIKTDLVIPYTSVFFELECGYWNTDAEENLRTAIAGSEKIIKKKK
ncbi:RbsD/FucU domain-containing protein [Cyclobacterium salsum]|uniref:RbsD/FucU domain-containing protein n=1 Tax=Cyclobacterium salsum TaxID=2666329 RepID=UPI001391A353|nr:RbsD/FucU domain-containing protein [Cyclobacterium salsum]